MVRRNDNNPNQLEFRLEAAGEAHFTSEVATPAQARVRARKELSKGKYLLDAVDRSKLPALSMPDDITAKFVASVIDQSVPMDDVKRRAIWNVARDHVDRIYKARGNTAPGYIFSFLLAFYDSPRDEARYPTKKAKRKAFLGWLASNNPNYDIAKYPGISGIVNQ